MRRFFALLLAGFLSIAAFSSCSGPVTKETGGTIRQDVIVKDMGNGMCHQLPAELMWQIDESKVFFSWEEAEDYAAGLILGGFNDWRLPTRNESLMLSELLLLKKGDCPIRTRKGHWVTDNNRRKPGFWDDYPLCGGSEFRWVKSKGGSVRAVRP